VDSAADGWDNSIALDSAGKPHISYRDSVRGDLKYAEWTGSVWSIQTVDSFGDVGWDNSLDLDSGGNGHISYRDSTTGALRYAEWTGSMWSIQTVDSSASMYDTSLALDSSGNAHISYHDYTNGHLKYAFSVNEKPVTRFPTGYVVIAGVIAIVLVAIVVGYKKVLKRSTKPPALARYPRSSSD